MIGKMSPNLSSHLPSADITAFMCGVGSFVCVCVCVCTRSFPFVLMVLLHWLLGGTTRVIICYPCVIIWEEKEERGKAREQNKDRKKAEEILRKKKVTEVPIHSIIIFCSGLSTKTIA